MINLTLEFEGSIDDYEYDIDEKTNIIMFHDVKRNVIIMGRALDAQITNERKEEGYDHTGNITYYGNISAYGTIKFEVYSFFKYNVSLNERFKIYWNERETVIWDAEEGKQVANKNIYKYLKNLKKEDNTEEENDEDDDYIYKYGW